MNLQARGSGIEKFENNISKEISRQLPKYYSSIYPLKKITDSMFFNFLKISFVFWFMKRNKGNKKNFSFDQLENIHRIQWYSDFLELYSKKKNANWIHGEADSVLVPPNRPNFTFLNFKVWNSYEIYFSLIKCFLTRNLFQKSF